MALFEDKAPSIMAGLIRDTGMKDFQAAGVLGNIGWECAGFESLSQIHGSAKGWVQWDGSRRDAFLSWCRNQGLVWTSDEANYRYLVIELRGTERAALNALLRTGSLGEASDTFEAKFERAGVPALAGRRQYAMRAWTAYEASDKKPIVAGPQPMTSDQPVIPMGPPPLSPRPPPAGDGLGEPTDEPPNFGGFFNGVRAFFAAIASLFTRGP